jgi:glycerophosphoryl diester phosphodiesterase
VDALAADLPDLRIGFDPCYGHIVAELQRSGDYARFVERAVDAAPRAELIYLHYPLVLDADRRGFDLVGAFHEAGRRVDAYTVERVDPETLHQVERLLALKVDQITTDDPEGLGRALAMPA